MRLIHVTAIILVVLVAGVSTAADRHWQTGTWTSVAIKRTPWVGAGGNRPFGPETATPARPAMPEVGTYVIETADQRIELEDVVPIGSGGSVALDVVVGGAVTFAIEKKTAYIRKDGKEYRLLVVRTGPKKKR